ncbi:CWF complex protein sap62 [Yamadazyma tenuis]|uniref:U1-type domain-containing protein n=1 Tax=Candida tenuis (strain ATCC 10573 / BCRC 21748 / CBS 615 / JCM 9827 / NBRC 10315 / NRRL Y-1498 / VKM Y-70) TaxID=590646 RepID=G3B985_CANTC|nr:uncharacterized protein CANTEDRAFT_107523 [Yamadazyma tenuis ATCC 10573]EGV61836.1 hypothetical protein CANTEDRAFT_107523 [Yamadazyma tenuis ATCC 10573]WEJ93063.1 CWF complex protein sap62 [Yamadazyma tenuis]
MDYSDRVNSKKGAGGVADAENANVHRKHRVRDLLTTSLLNLDSDPYVFRNHLGLLECKLCLTTHNNEASYLSHVGGKKHQLNLEKRRLLDEKGSRFSTPVGGGVSISTTPKRKWDKIGTPHFKVTKIRDPDTHRMGMLVHVTYSRATAEPLFRFQNYYELSAKNQNVAVSYHDKQAKDTQVAHTPADVRTATAQSQYLVVSCEPYENICVVIPGTSPIINPSTDTKTDEFWWHWDRDVGEFYLQFLYT